MNTGNDWNTFVAILKQASPITHEEITAETLLVGDLGLDSLALAELGVALVDAFPSTLLVDKIDRDWELVSVGDLFVECAPTARA